MEFKVIYQFEIHRKTFLFLSYIDDIYKIEIDITVYNSFQTSDSLQAYIRKNYEYHKTVIKIDSIELKSLYDYYKLTDDIDNLLNVSRIIRNRKIDDIIYDI